MTIANQVNFAGLRKRDTYDEIVNSLETHTLKLAYPDRKGTMTLNTPQVSAIRYGTAMDIDEQTEKMNKNKLIENIVNQNVIEY